VRRRVQNETLGTVGARAIRSIGSESSCSVAPSAPTRRAWPRAHAVGSTPRRPHDELLGAWLTKESLRDVYVTERVGEARTLLRKAIVGC
jgi:hypothetical protein